MQTVLISEIFILADISVIKIFESFGKTTIIFSVRFGCCACFYSLSLSLSLSLSHTHTHTHAHKRLTRRILVLLSVIVYIVQSK